MTTPVTQPRAHLDVNWVRAQFPSLSHRVNDQPAAFLDAPAGTQVPLRVVDAVRDYYLQSNSNTRGEFATSRESDAVIASAHAAMADLLHCGADEVFFGPNMTTLTFALARAIGRELTPGDEIVVTTLDHDANVAPWRALEERGVLIRQVDICPDDCTLDMADLRRKITPRTRLVAVGYASNAVGTINRVEEIIALARKAGAFAFIDAVHYAPHHLIDVRALDCDFLACSPYKFFGPHAGCLYGKREHLLRLRPYKVLPAPDSLPDRWETGTQTHELLAGVKAAVDYIAEVGRQCGGAPPEATRREAIFKAYRVIHPYETKLLVLLVAGLMKIPGLKFFGIHELERFSERCPTVSVRISDHLPIDIARFLGDRGIFTWDGNYYALNLTERLGVEKKGGLLRIGIVHYNTIEEIDRLLSALREFVARNS